MGVWASVVPGLVVPILCLPIGLLAETVQAREATEARALLWRQLLSLRRHIPPPSASLSRLPLVWQQLLQRLLLVPVFLLELPSLLSTTWP